MMRVRNVLTFVAVLLIAGSASAQTNVSVNGAAPAVPVTVIAGAPISAAVSADPGNATDWIGLYAVGAADGAYIDWRYLNDTTVPPAVGLTDASVHFLAPVTPGDYELRLFESNGYNRLATSAVVTVVPSPSRIAVHGVDPPPAIAIASGS